ncbi:hypothetical protein [Mesorhizobium sp. NZP2077]|uniref:hypothetical protein n=1 Tax=Mesorhizobium sp. NZP2077 TaxID=2483404 RepID=UPI001556C601|nr:hypothetical protein [Mesorhizobium sp. NZP2077]QKD17805.1 hypothetical protein HGP13_23715 [Mesorhizobium sp. NZP2077]
MATQRPKEDIWFAVRWRWLWAVRREGNIAMAKYAGATVVSAFAGVLLAAFVNLYVGIAVFAIGFGLSFWWFKALQRSHTDYSITYDDYFREKNNA